MSYILVVYFRYFLGLLTATVSSEVFKAAQPALLYLVPFTLLPLLTMAYLKVRNNLKQTNEWNKQVDVFCFCSLLTIG